MKKDFNYSYLICQIAHTITYLQDRCLIHYGLTNQQAKLLNEITKLSKSNKIFGRKDLEKSLNLKGPSITSLLNGLKNKKLINTEYNLKDNRRKILKVTEEGKKLIKHLNLVFEATENQLIDRLTNDEIDNLKEYLEVMYENMKEI